MKEKTEKSQEKLKRKMDAIKQKKDNLAWLQIAILKGKISVDRGLMYMMMIGKSLTLEEQETYFTLITRDMKDYEEKHTEEKHTEEKHVTSQGGLIIS